MMTKNVRGKQKKSRKYSHYIPLVFFAVIDISLNCIECIGKIDLPVWKDVIMQRGMILHGCFVQ
jgi:hypothetical protein